MAGCAILNYVDTVSPHNKEDSSMGCLGKHSGAMNKQQKWYTNANSLVGKMDEVRQRITGGKYDIVGITETWAHQGITDAELYIDVRQAWKRRWCITLHQ